MDVVSVYTHYKINNDFDRIFNFNSTLHNHIHRLLSATDLGRQVGWHNGGIDGYSSFIGFNPAKQTGLAILCSCYFTDVPPAEMIDTAMTFLLYH